MMTRSEASRRGMPAIRAAIAGYWKELADVAAEIDLAAVAQAANRLLDCQARGGVVFIVGNGGSAATASHMACDLAKGTRRDGPPTFRVVALTDNVPLLTAWANDTSYDRVFAEQLRSLAPPGDLLIAISASGNSPNVVAAVEAATSLGVETLAISGRRGGHIARLADRVIRVPSDRIEVVEDAHLIIAHSICVAVRERLAARGETVVLHPPVMPLQPIELPA
jgi:D-sedoheptulose 7-phosphate isomerase